MLVAAIVRSRSSGANFQPPTARARRDSPRSGYSCAGWIRVGHRHRLAPDRDHGASSRRSSPLRGSSLKPGQRIVVPERLSGATVRSGPRDGHTARRAIPLLREHGQCEVHGSDARETRALVPPTRREGKAEFIDDPIVQLPVSAGPPSARTRLAQSRPTTEPLGHIDADLVEAHNSVCGFGAPHAMAAPRSSETAGWGVAREQVVVKSSPDAAQDRESGDGRMAECTASGAHFVGCPNRA